MLKSFDLNSDLNVIPYQGVGSILLGIKREEIRSIFDENPRNFNPSSTDYFENVHIEYDGDICRSISLLSPLKPKFRGIDLLGDQSIDQLRIWLESINGEIQTNILGIITFRFGFSLYVPEIDIFQDEPPEAVTIFRVGYFDEFANRETFNFRSKLNKLYRDNNKDISQIDIDKL
jgi:hypothetical protein